MLGATGIEVSAYCLGTMNFGFVGNSDHENCAHIIHAALDHGINFIDTADMYSGGESEIIVGEAIKDRRDDVILATKVHFKMGEKPNTGGNSRRWIVKEVEDSLRRLQTDWIDLYQVHRPEFTTDIEETLGVLTDLVRQGKIRAFGCSTFPAEYIVESHVVAERRGLYRFRTEQPPYSLLARGAEAHVFPTCQRYNMGVLTWSPLAFGFLSGRYRKGQTIDLASGRPASVPSRFDPSAPGNAAKYEAVEQLIDLSSNVGRTLPEVALAFTVAHPAVTSTIIGPRTLTHLEGALKGSTLVLEDEILDQIDKIVPPGVNLYDPNASWPPPPIADPALRRRPLSERSAG